VGGISDERLAALVTDHQFDQFARIWLVPGSVIKADLTVEGEWWLVGRLI
jgi:hypothetical protein